MRIVIDTNVLISGVFFGGFPRKILSSIVNGKITAYATFEIINEYEEIIQEMIDRKQGHINRTILIPLIKTMEIIEPSSHIEICRDSDDNKFLECAKDSHALYIVSGDKDLLIIKEYENIQIITAKDFCEKYLLD
ncbi:MAG: putative toxin-antitoxin system toxin component, PIN family [Lachnospiraceae bacterium]|jgi:putative PIN family toxin of toxin-antitoxin system|nr:putative toxin-antitoxin system toxin component, PIN family [Lachnospiraceae bacterium]